MVDQSKHAMRSSTAAAKTNDVLDRENARSFANVGATRCGDEGMSSIVIPPYTSSIPFTDKQFDFLRNVARRHAGISIAEFKKSMILRRVRKRLKALSIETIEDYCKFLAGPNGTREIQPLINVLTTNKTSFFREIHHFQHLQAIGLPEAIARQKMMRRGKLRIWSAGCSTGEEAWSIAMVVCDSLGLYADSDVQILATDIDTEVLNTAERGIYDRSSFKMVPVKLRSEYLESVPGAQDQFEIARPLRRMVTFKKLNLHDPWRFTIPFDIIFCRNVVIYFDKPTQRLLFDRFASSFVQDGFLYCGHSELLHGLTNRFQPLGRSIYRRIL